MPLNVGDLLHNRYHIEKILARGGMGAVYLASDVNLGVRVAVKENLSIGDASARQFHREATILAALRHPNLPRVTDHFVLEGQDQYLVMDYIEGLDLREMVEQNGPIPETQAMAIGAAVCDALIYLHSQSTPIVHRDIKPGNIKLTPDGEVFLVDFGLAKAEQAGVTTATGAQAITPGFTSPEQYGERTDPRSDIYSLGATLYAVLSAHIPEEALARAMHRSELTPLRSLNSRVSPALAGVIEKAMQIDIPARYQSAAEFKQALFQAAAPGQAATAPAESAGRTRMLSTENSTGPTWPAAKGPDTSQSAPDGQIVSKVLQLGLFLVALLILAGFFWWWNSQRPPSAVAIQSGSTVAAVQPEEIHPTQEDVQPTPDLATPAPTLPLRPVEAASPESLPTRAGRPTATAPESTAAPAVEVGDGKDGAIAFASERSGTPQIWILEGPGKDPVQVTHLADGACQPDWSPDGTQLVFISPCPKRQDVYKGASLFFIRPDGTGLMPLVTVPGGDFDPDWSPDGNHIAFTSLRDGIPHIYVYNLEDQTTARLSSQSSNDRKPDWSTDGQWIAFESTRLGLSQIWTMRADGSSPREFSVLDSGAAFMPRWSKNGDVIVFVSGSNLPWLTARRTNDPAAPEVQISPLRPIGNPCLSPDNQWIIFEHTENGDVDLYRMTMNGGSLTRLTQADGEDYQPACRPSL
ncbi:MAG: protein kinase [Chloroflexi bacterium]|nr:protein kinase [Chloroflexota bacterium]